MAGEASAGDFAGKVVSHPSSFQRGPPSGQPPLQPPGGGGTFDGMEARVASLEAHVEHVRKDIAEMKGELSATRRDLNDVRVSLATLGERVAHLPGKGFIVSVVIASLTIVGGLIAVAPKIQGFVGTLQNQSK